MSKGPKLPVLYFRPTTHIPNQLARAAFLTMNKQYIFRECSCVGAALKSMATLKLVVVSRMCAFKPSMVPNPSHLPDERSNALKYRKGREPDYAKQKCETVPTFNPTSTCCISGKDRGRAEEVGST